MSAYEILRKKVKSFLHKVSKNKFVTKLTILFLIFFGIIFCLGRLTYNVTDSLTKGLYMKKLFPDYRKGRLVLFAMDKKYSKYIENFPNKDKMKHIYLLKRIVGTEGDIIETVSDGTLLINGEKKGKIFKIKGLIDNIGNTKYVLKKDEYYVMGDTETSFDSRYIGILRKKDFKYEMRLLIREETIENFLNKMAK